MKTLLYISTIILLLAIFCGAEVININFEGILQNACSGNAVNVSPDNCEELSCENMKEYCNSNCSNCVNQENCECTLQQCNRSVNFLRVAGDFSTPNPGRTVPVASISGTLLHLQGVTTLFYSFVYESVSVPANLVLSFTDLSGQEAFSTTVNNVEGNSGSILGQQVLTESQRNTLYSFGNWIVTFTSSSALQFSALLTKSYEYGPQPPNGSVGQSGQVIYTVGSVFETDNCAESCTSETQLGDTCTIIPNSGGLESCEYLCSGCDTCSGTFSVKIPNVQLGSQTELVYCQQVIPSATYTVTSATKIPETDGRFEVTCNLGCT